MWRILTGLDLKPRLVRGWLIRSDDPDLYAKAAEICALYLNQPPQSTVLSIDEKEPNCPQLHRIATTTR
ncbi:hypothetical protein [Streptomyces sp. NPDC056549]|uniref:hypothetical protein n=1 Tax=Streptomyces sp. NPDC056549 TaxID=3345864 RepID=UPI00368FFBB1